LDEGLRWEDQEQAVLFACSSLIAVVVDGDSRVVQFSHFSVKEFLTSDRLATSKLDAFRYHSIRLEAAHTIMSQACLSVLLHLDPNVDEESIKKYPLAEYAAEYFGDHAEFEGVFSHIGDSIDHLVDANKPHFATWLWARTRRWYIDPRRVQRQLASSPLYYVAELGFHNMVNYLILKRPEDLTVMGTSGTPLHAALYQRHANIAQLLAGHCVDVDIRNWYGTTPLHIATEVALPETVRILAGRNADINVRDNYGKTPLHGGAFRSDDRCFEVARFLLEHGADTGAKDDWHRTPLHLASLSGNIKTIKLLLERGADISARDKCGQTPLHNASYTMEISLEDRYLGAIRLLLEHNADVDALDNDHCTPLYEATAGGSIKIVQLLLEHGADIHVQNKKGQTPIHQALGNLKDRSSRVGFDAIRLLLRHGADVDALDHDYTTPLHVASHFGSVKATQLLLEYGASIQARDKKGQTPLHRVLDNMEEGWDAEDNRVDATRFLLDHGADVDALDEDHSSPLHVASSHDTYKATKLLLEHGANIHIRNKTGETPFQVASGRGHQGIMQLLSEDGQDGQHPQHLPLAA
jgi:ankyrin repeat protein